MIAAAVSPIAIPIGSRWTDGEITDATTGASGEAGWRSSVAKPAAESMKSPRHAASIRYSGQ